MKALNSINSLGAEKLETAQEILNNKADWLGFEFNIVNAENIVNAFRAGVSIHVIAYMPLNF